MAKADYVIGMISTVNTAGDRRETLADVAEQILRDQLRSVQEELEQLVEVKEQLESEKSGLQQERDTLAKEKNQIEESWQQTKQVKISVKCRLVLLHVWDIFLLNSTPVKLIYKRYEYTLYD